MTKMKTVTMPRGYNVLHCEVEGAIVNIRVGLRNTRGLAVTHVSVIPDPEWRVQQHTKHGLLLRRTSR